MAWLEYIKKERKLAYKWLTANAKVLYLVYFVKCISLYRFVFQSISFHAQSHHEQKQKFLDN